MSQIKFEPINDSKAILFYHMMGSIVEKLFEGSEHQMLIRDIQMLIYNSLSPFWKSLGYDDCKMFESTDKYVFTYVNLKFESKDRKYLMRIKPQYIGLGGERGGGFILNFNCVSSAHPTQNSVPVNGTVFSVVSQRNENQNINSPSKILFKPKETTFSCTTTFEFNDSQSSKEKEILDLKKSLEETTMELNLIKEKLAKANDKISELEEELNKQKIFEKKRNQQEGTDNEDMVIVNVDKRAEKRNQQEGPDKEGLNIVNVDKRSKVIDVDELAISMENPNYCVLNNAQPSNQPYVLVADFVLFFGNEVEFKAKGRINVMKVHGFELNKIENIYCSDELLIFQSKGSENWVSFPMLQRKVFIEKLDELKKRIPHLKFGLLNEKENLDSSLVKKMSSKDVEFKEKNFTKILESGSTVIRISDLYIIENNNFMNNEIYNCFLKYLINEIPKVRNLVYFFETFFFVQIVRIEEKLRKMNLEEMRQHKWLIVPINILTIHWYLICVNLVEINNELKAHIYTVDSLQKNFEKEHALDQDNVSKFLMQYLSVKSFTTEYRMPPQQTDGTSCGYRIISNMLYCLKYIFKTNKMQNSLSPQKLLTFNYRDEFVLQTRLFLLKLFINLSMGKDNDQEVEDFLKKKLIDIELKIIYSKSPQRILDKISCPTLSPNEMMKLPFDCNNNDQDSEINSLVIQINKLINNSSGCNPHSIFGSDSNVTQIICSQDILDRTNLHGDKLINTALGETEGSFGSVAQKTLVVDSHEEKQITGSFPNIGNSCYISVSLQTFYRLPDIGSFIHIFETNSTILDDVMEEVLEKGILEPREIAQTFCENKLGNFIEQEMRNLVSHIYLELINDDPSVVSEIYILKLRLLFSIYSNKKVNEQHDPDEFLRFLFLSVGLTIINDFDKDTQIQGDILKATDEYKKGLFYSQLSEQLCSISIRNTLCKNNICNKTSHTIQPYFIMPLSFPDNTKKITLKKLMIFNSVQILERVFCSCGSEIRLAESHLDPPDFLILRFTREINCSNKIIDCLVDFETTNFDLSFLSNLYENISYDLTSLSYHTGDNNNGHYINISKVGDRIIQFNDSKAEEVRDFVSNGREILLCYKKKHFKRRDVVPPFNYTYLSPDDFHNEFYVESFDNSFSPTNFGILEDDESDESQSDNAPDRTQLFGAPSQSDFVYFPSQNFPERTSSPLPQSTLDSPISNFGDTAFYTQASPAAPDGPTNNCVREDDEEKLLLNKFLQDLELFLIENREDIIFVVSQELKGPWIYNNQCSKIKTTKFFNENRVIFNLEEENYLRSIGTESRVFIEGNTKKMKDAKGQDVRIFHPFFYFLYSIRYPTPTNNFFNTKFAQKYFSMNNEEKAQIGNQQKNDLWWKNFFGVKAPIEVLPIVQEIDDNPLYIKNLEEKVEDLLRKSAVKEEEKEKLFISMFKKLPQPFMNKIIEIILRKHIDERDKRKNVWDLYNNPVVIKALYIKKSQQLSYEVFTNMRSFLEDTAHQELIPSQNIMTQYEKFVSHNLSHGNKNLDFVEEDGGCRMKNLVRVIEIMLWQHSILGLIKYKENGKFVVYLHYQQDGFGNYTVFNLSIMGSGMSQKLSLLHILGLYPLKEEKALKHMVATVEELALLNGRNFHGIPHEDSKTFTSVKVNIRMISDLKSRRLFYSFHTFLLIIFITPDNETKAKSIVIRDGTDKEKYLQILNNKTSDEFKELLQLSVPVHNFNEQKTPPKENQVFYDFVEPTSKTCGSDFTIALRTCSSCGGRSSFRSPFFYCWMKKINEKQEPKDLESLKRIIMMIKKVDKNFASKLEKKEEDLKKSNEDLKIKEIWKMIIEKKKETKPEFDVNKDPKTVEDCKIFISIISRFDRSFAKTLQDILSSKNKDKIKVISNLIKEKRKDFPSDFAKFCVACYFLYTSKNPSFYIVSESHLKKIVKNDLEYDSCILHLPIRFGESCIKEIAILVVTVTGNFKVLNDAVAKYLQPKEGTSVSVLEAHWSTKYKDQSQFSHISKCMVELSTRDGTAMLRFFEKGALIMTEIFNEMKKYTQDTFETIDESFADNLSHRITSYRDSLVKMEELPLPHSPDSPNKEFTKKSAVISNHPQLAYQISKLVKSINQDLLGNLNKIKNSQSIKLKVNHYLEYSKMIWTFITKKFFLIVKTAENGFKYQPWKDSMRTGGDCDKDIEGGKLSFQLLCHYVYSLVTINNEYNKTDYAFRMGYLLYLEVRRYESFGLTLGDAMNQATENNNTIVRSCIENTLSKSDKHPFRTVLCHFMQIHIFRTQRYIYFIYEHHQEKVVLYFQDCGHQIKNFEKMEITAFKKLCAMKIEEKLRVYLGKGTFLQTESNYIYVNKSNKLKFKYSCQSCINESRKYNKSN